MKIMGKLFVLAAVSGLLMSCKPGPVHLDSMPLMGFDSPKVAVQNPRGQIKYVSTKIDKKRVLMVPPSTGSHLTTNKILAEFAQDPILSPYHIQVRTHRGVVTLSGQVPSKAVKDHAISAARQNTGVLAVEAGHLVVEKP